MLRAPLHIAITVDRWPDGFGAPSPAQASGSQTRLMASGQLDLLGRWGQIAKEVHPAQAPQCSAALGATPGAALDHALDRCRQEPRALKPMAIAPQLTKRDLWDIIDLVCTKAN